jgi:hypothetical protein
VPYSGEQLETLHHFRSLAQSVSLLLSYYLSVANPPDPVRNPDGTETTPQTPLEILFATRSSRDGRAKLAVILRRLVALAKDVAENAAAADLIASSEDEEKKESVSKADLEKAESIRAEVSKFAEQFEKECLRLFDKSYRKGDIKMMAVCCSGLCLLDSCSYILSLMIVAALCKDAAELQWRNVVYSDVCQPARLFHQSGPFPAEIG